MESSDVDFVVMKTSRINVSTRLEVKQVVAASCGSHSNLKGAKEGVVKSIQRNALVCSVTLLRHKITILHLLLGHPNIVDVREVCEVQKMFAA